MKNLLLFLAGGVIGGVMGYVIASEKSKAKAEDEIQEMKQYYAKKRKDKVNDKENIEDDKQHEEEPDEDEELNDEELANKYDERIHLYNGSTTVINRDAPSGVTQIMEEEYMEEDGWDEMSLVCYSDGVVIDDQSEEELIDGTEEIVHAFEKNREDEILYFKNEKLKLYYEVIRKEISWEEVISDGR